MKFFFAVCILVEVAAFEYPQEHKRFTGYENNLDKSDAFEYPQERNKFTGYEKNLLKSDANGYPSFQRIDRNSNYLAFQNDIGDLIPGHDPRLKFITRAYKAYKLRQLAIRNLNNSKRTTIIHRGKKGFVIRQSNLTYKEAEKLFNSAVKNITQRGDKVKVGKTYDGRTLTLRTQGNNGPTLDVKDINGHVTKLRLMQ